MSGYMNSKETAGMLGEQLIKRRETIAVAESVTSGSLQAALSQADNASRFYEGGITAYNLPQKVKHFDVDFSHAVQCNCVSEQVAINMAAGCVKLFETNWAIGITGYATPLPELGINDLFAVYAIVHNDQVVKTGRVGSGKNKIEDAQEDFSQLVLQELTEYLTGKNNGANEQRQE